MGIAAAISAPLAALAAAWMRVFTMGPGERVGRAATHLRVPRLMRA